MSHSPKDEEFGFFTSRLYYLFSRTFPSMGSFYDFIKEDISERGFSSMLDIGCGPGVLDVALAQKFPKSRIYGIDPSKYMIKEAKSLSSKKLVSNIEFSVGKNTDIPTEDKFDLIITTLSFHHWAVKREALEYISERLSPEGTFAIYEFLRPEKRIGISGSHSLSISEAKSYSDLKGMLLSEVKTKRGFIKVIFKKRSTAIQE